MNLKDKIGHFIFCFVFAAVILALFLLLIFGWAWINEWLIKNTSVWIVGTFNFMILTLIAALCLYFDNGD